MKDESLRINKISKVVFLFLRSFIPKPLSFIFLLSFILCPFFIPCLAGPLSLIPTSCAGPDITGIAWQSSSGFGKAKRLLPFTTILQWRQGPLDKPPGHLRILVTLTNKEAKSVEGSILRCSISMHLVKHKARKPGQDSQDTNGVWGVPFWIEERRVPKIKPAKSKEVVISHFNLQEYLKRLRGTGFWLDALKVRIMVEPRVGESLKTIPESIIPVVETGSRIP